MNHRYAYVLFFFLVPMLTGTTPAASQHNYKTDRGHTEVLFTWSHSGVSQQHAEFTELEGELKLFPDQLEKSSVAARIKSASVRSGYEPMDTVLKSSRLLDVEKYPDITFQSTTLELTGEGRANVTGDLTVHGVTLPIVLDTKLTHKGGHPLAPNLPSVYRGEWLAFHATATIDDHTLFGVGNSMTLGTKWWIKIDIHTELKRQYE